MKKMIWGVIAALLLLTTCVYGGKRLMNTTQEANADAEIKFAELIKTGMPPKGDPYYSTVLNKAVSAETLEKLTLQISQGGNLLEMRDTACSFRAYAGTEELNGKFRECEFIADFEKASAKVKMKWREKGGKGDWKLLSLNIKAINSAEK